MAEIFGFDAYSPQEIVERAESIGVAIGSKFKVSGPKFSTPVATEP